MKGPGGRFHPALSFAGAVLSSGVAKVTE